MMESNELAPVSMTERIVIMDVLRGFALIGIVFMNIEWFNRPISELGGFDETLTGWDHATGWLVRCFIEGKFYKLFALLFGMGFAVMLLRAKETSKPFNAWFFRRMLVLFVIGILHMVFLWEGDILHDYAFAGILFLGLIALLKRERFQKYDNPRFFLKLSLTWLLLPMVISLFIGIGFGSRFDPDRLQTNWQQEQQIYTQFQELKVAELENNVKELTEKNDETLINDKLHESVSIPSSTDNTQATSDIGEPVDEDEGSEEDLTPEELVAKKAQEKFESYTENKSAGDKEIKVFTEDTYWQATKFRAKQTLKKLAFTPMFGLILLLPIFILGHWLISSGILKNHKQHTPLFKSMAWVGMGFGLFFTVGGLVMLQHPATNGITPLLASGNILFGLGQFVMAAGYLGLVVCLFQTKRWQKWLAHLIPFGRMALTNYIMQTVILTSIFYGYAGGLFGEVSRSPQMLIVLAIVLFQILFSKWWLKSYQFGPLEWVWRCLSYKKLFPLKIAN